MKKRPLRELTKNEKAERRVRLYATCHKEIYRKAWDRREAVFQLRFAGETWTHIGQSMGITGTRAKQMFQRREEFISRGYSRP